MMRTAPYHTATGILLGSLMALVIITGLVAMNRIVELKRLEQCVHIDDYDKASGPMCVYIPLNHERRASENPL